MALDVALAEGEHHHAIVKAHAAPASRRVSERNALSLERVHARQPSRRILSGGDCERPHRFGEPLYTLCRRSSADSLEYSIDHHAGKAEVIRRVAKLAELLAVDVLRDCGVLAQKIEQGPVLPDRLAAQVIDQVVSVLA